MHSIQIDPVIGRIISFFYRIGFWHRGDEATAGEQIKKWFYFIYFFLYLISLVVRAIESDENVQSIFLVEVAIAVAVLLVKLWALIWKQQQIIELLNRICIFTVSENADFMFVNEKLIEFSKYSKIFIFASLIAGFFELAVVPFLGAGKTLFSKLLSP